MKILTSTTDGFVLAEADLKMRGAGDMLGNRQSGLPEFKVGNPINDINILEVAQEEAKRLYDDEDLRDSPETMALKSFISAEYEQLNNFD